MAESTVPVDLLNPGQVFACVGLAEVADVLVGVHAAGFHPSPSGEVRFHIAGAGDASPVSAVMAFLRDADVSSTAPEGSPLDTEKWKVPTQAASHAAAADGAFPVPCPSSPATLPALLSTEHATIVIDHWGDGTIRDNAKFWAGSGGYPGVGLLRDALELVRPALTDPEGAEAVEADPFSLSAAQSSSFRFDWRRDYVPLGVGFSLNAHGAMQPVGYPLVETLAAIGLTHARPLRPDPRDKLHYRYGVALGDLPLPLLRAALGCAPLPVPTRTFRMVLAWPGKENQARCITDVVEETRP